MEWMNIDAMIQGFLLAWLIVNFEPLQNVVSKIKYKWPRKALGCFKCLSLWIVLLISLDPFTAIAASLFAFLFDKYINTGTKL